VGQGDLDRESWAVTPFSIQPFTVRTGTRTTIDAVRERGWKFMVAATGELLTNGIPYAVDSGAWTAHTKGRPFDMQAYQTAVLRLGRDAEWVALPDIVGGGLASLDLSLSSLVWTRQHTARVFLVLQDGMLPEHVAGLDVDGWFLGGSTEWKLRTLPMWGACATEHGRPLHVGRVNSAKRIKACIMAGAASFDGASVSLFPSTLPALDAAARWKR
jgi:hypothetical protein